MKLIRKYIGGNKAMYWLGSVGNKESIFNFNRCGVVNSRTQLIDMHYGWASSDFGIVAVFEI